MEGSKRLAEFLPRMQHLQGLELHGPETLGESNSSVEFLRGFRDNKSLTDVHIEWLDEDDESKANIAYYTTRNRYAPSLAVASKVKMLEIFETLVADEGNAGLTVVFDTLRARDDWCAIEDQAKRTSPTKKPNSSQKDVKKARTTT